MARLAWLLPLIGALAAFMLVREGGQQPRNAVTSVAAPDAWPADDPRRHTGDDRVVMVAADWCGYCRKLRQQLDLAKVPYQVIDVESTEGSRAMVALGARGVPVTVIGQHVVLGYDTQALDEQFGRLGYRVF